MDCAAYDGSLVASAAYFFDDEKYRRVGDGIVRKRPLLAYLFRMVNVLSRTRLGNALLLVAVILGYSALRRPSQTPLFQYGISANNERVFRRLNAAALRSGWDCQINGERLSLGRRLAVLGRLRALWRMAGVLSKGRAVSPFVHTQLVLTAAAWRVYDFEKFYGVKCVCIASDHSPIVMGLLHAARAKGLRTCYAQHAPVAEHFPPLDYDLTVLFDRASAAIYDRAAARRDAVGRGQVVILPPFESDAVWPVVASPPYRIGICLSYLFHVDALVGLIHILLSHHGVSIVSIRRHPRCKADLTVLQADGRVSEAARGSLSEFVKGCDVVLVPNSGVAIELLHLGVAVMYTPDVDFIDYDYYGFVKHGIVPIFNSDMLSSPEKLQSFFGGEWRQRYLCFDETIQQPLEVSRNRAGAVFRELVEGPGARNVRGDTAVNMHAI